MTDLPWYKFFPGDYGRDTGDLSMIEDVVYRRLLDAYYCNRGLPSDPSRLQRVARASTPEEKAAVEFVVKRFFRADGERLMNGRAEREIEARDAYFAEQRRKGNLGGRPPKQPRNNPGDNPGDNPGVKPGVKPGQTRGVSHEDLEVDVGSDSKTEEDQHRRASATKGVADAPHGSGGNGSKAAHEDAYRPDEWNAKQFPDKVMTPTAMVGEWNRIINRYRKQDDRVAIPLVKKLSPDRQKKCAVRIKNLDLRLGQWAAVVNRVGQDDFHAGVVPSKQNPNWKATFDWIVETDKRLLRFLEDSDFNGGGPEIEERREGAPS